jgi:gluconolactonase
MRPITFVSYVLFGLVAVSTAPRSHATVAAALVPDGKPLATIDLRTDAGVALVQGQWRYSDTRIVPADFKRAGADGQPDGAPVKTYDYEPHAGAADFDDASWQAIPPTTLEQRRGNGKLSFNWYRIALTVPQYVGEYATNGSTLVFETSLDDYAEVWVDGELARAQAQRGGSVVAGWNAPNRLIVGRNVRPGQKIQLAIFGINGPISNAPTNFIWMREAVLSFYPPMPTPLAVEPQEVNVDVERLDPRIDAIVPANAKVFKLAEGFQFTEGPIWVDGALLFSDPNANTIYRYSDTDGLSVYREHSGYGGADIAEYGQPGSNGLTLDPQHRLTINEHGNHRVTRLDANGQLVVLADRYHGKRLNSPNDLVYRSDGSLYFTDPPFGLPKFYDDPRKELDFSGVYLVLDGEVTLVSRDLDGPNGLAFSPDEQFLYVDNWDTQRKVVMRYPVKTDGTLGDGTVFFDMTGAPGEEALDGLKVDRAGNLYVSGPGGVWVIAPDGTHLGTIKPPRLPANFAWGGADGRTLYLAARSSLYRIDLNVAGAGVGAPR